MRKFTLFLIDVLVLYASLLAMLAIRYGQAFGLQYQAHLLPFGIIFLLWLLIFYIASLYDPHTFRNTPHFYSSLFRAITIASSISIIFFYLIPIFGITPKTNLFIFAGIFAVLNILGRSFFNHITQKNFKKFTIIVGDTQSALE